MGCRALMRILLQYQSGGTAADSGVVWVFWPERNPSATPPVEWQLHAGMVRMEETKLSGAAVKEGAGWLEVAGKTVPGDITRLLGARVSAADAVVLGAAGRQGESGTAWDGSDADGVDELAWGERGFQYRMWDRTMSLSSIST